MSEEKKSPIISTSVAFGKNIQQPSGAQKKIIVPWRVLVCSDMGFVSKKPERLHASSCNDFLSDSAVVLRGTVDSICAGKPVFIEYPVKESADFSAQKIRHSLPFTVAMQLCCDALRGLLQGTHTIDRALSLVNEQREQIPLAAEIGAKLKQAQDISGTRKNTPPPPVAASKNSLLDSILDSVVVDAEVEKTPEQSKNPVSSFAAAIVGNAILPLPKEEIESMLDLMETMIVADVTLVLSQPFFSECKSAWLACKHCAKIIGRDQAVSLTVFSTPSVDIHERFADALRICGEAGGVPDIVLFDYPIQYTNAHADLLAAICSVAEANNVMILASLASDVPLVKQIPHADTVRTMLDDPVYIPYKRFRSNSFARTVCLCAPDGALSADDVLTVTVGGGWLVLFTLLQKLHDNRSPFDGTVSLEDMGLTAEFPLRFSAGMTGAHSEEIASFGISLLSDKTATRAGVSLVTAIDGETVAPSYTSFAYNLLVNRLLAITAHVVQVASGNRNTCVTTLTKEITGLLAQYRLLHSENEVIVTPEGDHEITVSIDSQKTVDGFPLKIEFSAGI